MPKNNLSNVRLSSEFYKVHLKGDPYSFTEAEYKEHTGKSVNIRRRLSRPRTKSISFEHNIVEFELDSRKENCVVSIQVASGFLNIACNCGKPVENLCVHAMEVLETILLEEDDFYFKQFQPNGVVETAQKYSKNFEKKLTGVNLYFKPKKHLGHVYKFEDRILPSNLGDILCLPSTTGKPLAKRPLTEKRTTLVYFLMFSPSHFQNMPSFLLHNLGVKNKAGTHVKGFEPFLDGIERDHVSYLTEDQIFLNGLCRDMWKLAQDTNGRLLENEKKDRRNLIKLYGLWEKIMPYLQHQEYIYAHPFYWPKNLKGKPRQGIMQRIVVKKDRPELFFQLIDKGDYYLLKLKVMIDSKIIARFNADARFFIENDANYYMVSSLRDAGILEWMEAVDNSITIFKEHFEEFDRLCLKRLRQNYTVAF